MKKLILACFTLLMPFLNASADAPTCHEGSSGVPYCEYKGKVKTLYVNSDNQILLYFDEPAPSFDSIDSAITQRSAAVVNMNTHPEFAKLFYSTALSAQATNRKVVIHMRSRQDSYSVIDRIWLNE